MTYIEKYKAHIFHEETDFDGLKGIKKKRCFLGRLSWNSMEGDYVISPWDEFDYKINDLKHLNNWVKKYKDEKVIENLEEVIKYFKEIK